MISHSKGRGEDFTSMKQTTKRLSYKQRDDQSLEEDAQVRTCLKRIVGRKWISKKGI